MARDQGPLSAKGANSAKKPGLWYCVLYVFCGLCGTVGFSPFPIAGLARSYNDVRVHGFQMCSRRPPSTGSTVPLT